MTALRLSLICAAALGVLAAAGGAGAQSPTLFGVVGPGFSIKLSDASGNPVKSLDPGTYTIQVDDKADIHNFHLTGPGIDKATEVETTGTVTWTVTFASGSYRYQCDPHSSTMFGTFTVGGAPPPTTTTTPTPAPTRLAAAVGPGKRIVVTRTGRKVVSLKAGRVVLVVADRSTTDNFHLTGPGVNRATTRAGRTTTTWRLTLKPGLYRYRSDATPTLKGSFRVV
jgi:hypothetical protein